MLFYKNGKWHFCTEKVRYIQHEREITQLIGQEGKQWWLDFEEKWDHTNIIEFILVEEPSEEQIQRLGEVNLLRIPEDYNALVENYVLRNIFPQDYCHPLALLQAQKENEQQGIELSEREIQEIILGRQISEIEIDLLELKLGGE